MPTELEFFVVIPARYGSTRLPGKPLRLIAGEPMIRHVARRALVAGAAEVVIATDDARIEAALGDIKVRVCMTRAEHASGSDRLAEGFRLLDAGLSPRMLITGVAQGVSLQQVIDGMSSDKSVVPSPENLACCVTLGYEAGNTVGNAVETATWVRDNKIASVRLVTANYHMKRSQLEFHRALPGISIIPHPVFPKEMQDNWWFVKPRILILLAGEYHKFVGAWARGILQDSLIWLDSDHVKPGWWPDWANFDWSNIHLPDWKWPDWLPRP